MFMLGTLFEKVFILSPENIVSFCIKSTNGFCTTILFWPKKAFLKLD